METKEIKNFRKGLIVKTPNGSTLDISHFIHKGKKRNFYKPGDKIVIEGIGTFNAKDLQIVDAREK